MGCRSPRLVPSGHLPQGKLLKPCRQGAEMGASLRLAAQMLFFMSSNPVLRYQEAPTGAASARSTAVGR